MATPDEATKCRVRGCRNDRDPENLMCSTCWSLVPADKRLELYKAGARFKREAIDTTTSGFRNAQGHLETARLAALSSAERGGRDV